MSEIYDSIYLSSASQSYTRNKSDAVATGSTTPTTTASDQMLVDLLSSQLAPLSSVSHCLHNHVRHHSSHQLNGACATDLYRDSQTVQLRSTTDLNTLNDNKTGDQNQRHRFEFVNNAYTASANSLLTDEPDHGIRPGDFITSSYQQQPQHRPRSNRKSNELAEDGGASNYKSVNNGNKQQAINNSRATVKNSAETGPGNSKCICKNNEKHFRCVECTRHYPIRVHRSANDDESGRLAMLSKLEHDRRQFEMKLSQAAAPKAAVVDELTSSGEQSISESSSYSSCSANASSTESECYDSIILNLKPSPIPVSPGLIALLALTKSSSTFRPPPNISLSDVNQHQQSLGNGEQLRLGSRRK
jgi:hypothetical protein